MTARIDLAAIRSNLHVIRSLASDRIVMACIKGNAYGHGLLPLARCLEDAGTDEAAALARGARGGAQGVDGKATHANGTWSDCRFLT